MFTNVTNKFWNLVMIGLANVHGPKICIEVYMHVAGCPTPDDAWLPFAFFINSFTQIEVFP